MYHGFRMSLAKNRQLFIFGSLLTTFEERATAIALVLTGLKLQTKPTYQGWLVEIHDTKGARLTPYLCENQ